MNIHKVELPKWPQLIVAGEPVTKDQAAEIMIKTTNLNFCSNDDEFEDELYSVIDKTFGWKFDSDDRYKNINERTKKLYTELNLTELGYLDNNRILSSWVGGPKGWIDWEGIVGCCNYNIGKWPTATEVLHDWKKIARMFPYLYLRCQLMSGESCEDNYPLIEYIVKDGKVSFKRPTERLVSNVPYTDPCDFMVAMQRNMYEEDNFKERGCTLEQFEAALKLAIDYNPLA